MFLLSLKQFKKGFLDFISTISLFLMMTKNLNYILDLL